MCRGVDVANSQALVQGSRGASGMKELITIEQANHIMLAILIAAPLIGLIWGAIARRVGFYTICGVAIGGGNYVMWTAYSSITNHLGLDTVKNLLVNLGLFIVVGVVAGLAIGRWSRRQD
jgi:hypothetical protein